MVIQGNWSEIAGRIVHGLGVQPGELIYVRDHTGRFELLPEVLLAIELAGATPLPQIDPAEYMERLWAGASIEYLSQWDRRRLEWTQQCDRILVLAGAGPDMRNAPAEALQAWLMADERLVALENERLLPFLLVAIPTARRAQQLGLSPAELDAHVLPALAVKAEVLQGHIQDVLQAVHGHAHFTIRTDSGNGGKEHELHLYQGDRHWLSDDGLIDDADRAAGAIASNMPAGSIYTTVVERETHGSLYLPSAGDAKDVVFHFDSGRLVRIEASTPSAAQALEAVFDSHSGEPRRVAHIGIGLNPALRRPIGWTLVDEHLFGGMFLSLGENRYMGGQNESSLNVDYFAPAPIFLAGGREVMAGGVIHPRVRPYTK